MKNKSVSEKYWIDDYLPYQYSRWDKGWILFEIKNWMKEKGVSLKCNLEEIRKLPKKVLKEQCLIAPGHDPEKPYHDSEACFLNISNIEKLTSADIKELISDYGKCLYELESSRQEIWECSFPALSGTRKRLKPARVLETGPIVNGTWFIRPDGSRKRVSANGFEKIRRLAEKEGKGPVTVPVPIPEKGYRDFPLIDIGEGVKGTLILAGGNGIKEDFFLEKLENEGMAYLVEGYIVNTDVFIKPVAEYQNWLKIYGNQGLLKEFRADRIIVWNGRRAVIQLINEKVNTKLYKNVDICDLESILEKGILSLDECGNDNWEEGKRANNPTDLVYLFGPIKGRDNAYPRYGVALIETDIKDVQKSEFLKRDVHRDDYIEYTASKVEPGQITRILIPGIFKERLHLPAAVEEKVEWCGMTADIYDDGGYKPASDEILKRFAETAEIESCSCYPFFRGKDENGRIFELDHINYIFR